MDFMQAPMIVSTRHGYGPVYVEGDVDALNGNEKQTFEYACQTMAHLIPARRRATGAQWMRLIAQQYDAANPKTADVLRVIGKGMLVSKFSDDHMLFDKFGVPQFRGTERQCREMTLSLQGRSVADSGWKTRPTAESFNDMPDVQLAMARRWVDRNSHFKAKLVNEGDELAGQSVTRLAPIDLPVGMAIQEYAYGQDGPSEFSRALELLKQSPIHPESLTPSQGEDASAQDSLLCQLAEGCGYGSLVTSGAIISPSQNQTAKVEAPGSLTSAQINDSMDSFFSDILSRGWNWQDQKNKVFLCRPAPIYNPMGSMRPFESMVHPKLIGWRVLSPIVERSVARVQERIVEEHRQSGRQSMSCA